MWRASFYHPNHSLSSIQSIRFWMSAFTLFISDDATLWKSVPNTDAHTLNSRKTLDCSMQNGTATIFFFCSRKFFACSLEYSRGGYFLFHFHSWHFTFFPISLSYEILDTDKLCSVYLNFSFVIHTFHQKEWWNAMLRISENKNNARKL